MTGILYFSGTGNSLYIAQSIQEKLGGKILYIPKYKADGGEFDRMIVVCPIYSFGLPRHVYELLPKLSRKVPLDVVLNYGGMIAGADYFTYEYAKGLGLKIRSVHTVKMPENYTLTFTVPKFYLNSTLKAAPKRIRQVVASLEKEEEKLPKPKRTKAELYLKNKDNWYKIAQGFRVNESCTACGKCVSLCPVENISIREGKVTFGDKCIACLGCYHRCPRKAIDHGDKKKAFRYVNPYIKESDIGKDR